MHSLHDVLDSKPIFKKKEAKYLTTGPTGQQPEWVLEQDAGLEGGEFYC